MARSQSQATLKAAEYLKRNPGTPAYKLAQKFGVDVTTIYRSPWWKAAKGPTNA